MTYTPAQAAERSGLSLDTLRYYEREELLPPVARTAGGHRAYSDDDLAWAGILTCLRDAGLGIAELREFTRLLRAEAPGADRVGFLRRRREELLERRRLLDAALAVLDGQDLLLLRAMSPLALSDAAQSSDGW